MTSFKEASERLEGRNKSGTGTSSRTEQKFLINMPCKYHKKGICKLGKSCRFLHANQKTKKTTTTVNLPTTAEKTVCVQISKFGRRPFLQLVVLYASDTRVSKYADEILEILLDAGIDVVVQNSIQQGSFSPQIGTKVPKAKDIKAEHLAELICTSHADFLIVVGDKNMKNRSCQAKRKGKLLEMMVEDVISLIWKSWPQNPHKTLARIKSLTTEQTTSLLFQYCGPKHISDRFEYLCTLKKEILSTYKIGSWCDSLEDKFANLQKCAITLHKQLKKAMKVLSELSVQVENPELSRGSVKTFEYKPSACRTPKSTIAYPLQIHLYCFIVDMMKSIEETFVSLRFPNSLWSQYYSEHVGNWHVNLEELERIRDEMWKALEEHEQALLNQEEEKDEEGMFSDLKEGQDGGAMLGELEADEKPDDSNQSTSESSSSSSSEGSTATPVKFPFSFPMPKTPIFIPPKNEPPESEESPLQERAKDHTQEQTSTPSASGLGRGSVGIGRGSRTTDASPSTDVSTRFSGLGRGTISREPRPDSINASGRRSSTGAVELPGEFGLGQRRDWPARASGAAALTREPGQRRLSDLGMTRNLMGSTDSPGLSRAFSEPRLFSDDRQRPLTKEEKLLALQLDRQLERRLELERQLERERELEKELERQLEKRKQKSDLGRTSVESDSGTRTPVGTGSRRESQSKDAPRPISSSFSPFALSPSSPTLPSPRRTSFQIPSTTASIAPPPGLPPPSSRSGSISGREDEVRSLSRRESVGSGYSPFGAADMPLPSPRNSFSQVELPPLSPRSSFSQSDVAISPRSHYSQADHTSPRGSFSQSDNISPRSSNFGQSDVGLPSPRTSFSQPGTYSPFSDTGKSTSISAIHERGVASLREVGAEIETRSSRSSSNASPRPPTPGGYSEPAGHMRDLTLFPTTTMYGSAQRADPFYQEISKIWGQGAQRMSISEVPLTEIEHPNTGMGDLGESAEVPPVEINRTGDEEYFYESDTDESSPRTSNGALQKTFPPKLALQHGFVLKPDPVAST